MGSIIQRNVVVCHVVIDETVADRLQRQFECDVLELLEFALQWLITESERLGNGRD